MAFGSRTAPTTCAGALSAAYSMPFTSARPDVGRSNPRTMRIVVDLPAPWGPMKPVTTPAATPKLRSCTAVRVPKRLVNASTLIINAH